MGYNKAHGDQISPVPPAGPPGTRVLLWAQFRGGGQHPQNHTGSAGGGHTRPTSTPRPPPPWEGLILAGRSIRRPALLWEPRKGHVRGGGGRAGSLSLQEAVRGPSIQGTRLFTRAAKHWCLPTRPASTACSRLALARRTFCDDGNSLHLCCPILRLLRTSVWLI